ncbi:hypothetical protein ACFVR6_02420 [Microbacterium sp. NPDC058021]|uniref:hypothetical protein n=1 Tax=Microbacterium sp. NPDC058021 TaxID=3346306 RepID=UPI0036DE10C8
MEAFDGGTWEDYCEWMAEVSAAGAAAGTDVWGGVDPSTRLVNFENVLRAQGRVLFNDDSKIGFYEDDLRAFWVRSSTARGNGAGATARSNLQVVNRFAKLPEDEEVDRP